MTAEVVTFERPGYTPSADYVLVRIKPVEEVTRGGIYVPDTVKEKQTREAELGTVVAIGPEAFDGGPAWYKPGDRVVVAKHAFTFIPGSAELVLMRDVDVLAVET